MPKRRHTAVASKAGTEAWTLLYELLRAKPVLDEVASTFELSASQVSLLHTLEPKGAVTMVSLARALQCHDSNVTGLVDKLERRGLIERRGVPTDRRVKLISLTAAGEALRAKMLARLFEPPAFIAQMSEPDQRVLRGLMKRASQRVADTLEASDPGS
jgi:MarR family transcriptional regulator, organic hydroperoxide resistance regulator